MKGDFLYILKLMIAVVASAGAAFMIFGILGYVADLPNYRFLVFAGIVLLGCIAFPLIILLRYHDSKNEGTQIDSSKERRSSQSDLRPLQNGV